MGNCKFVCDCGDCGEVRNHLESGTFWIFKHEAVSQYQCFNFRWTASKTTVTVIITLMTVDHPQDISGKLSFPNQREHFKLSKITFLVKLIQPLLEESLILNSQVMNAKNVCLLYLFTNLFIYYLNKSKVYYNIWLLNVKTVKICFNWKLYNPKLHGLN